jgi:Fe-S-cluster-containing hydrogenase component 2
MKEHILIRCQGCEQERCTVSCGSNAVAYILGDLLIEPGKCGVCGRKAAPIPACIADCLNAPEKRVLDIVPIEEKRRAAAEKIPR